jgi:hypothetical protein
LDTEILGAEAIAANPHKEPYPRRSGNLELRFGYGIMMQKQTARVSK